jgi:hypothetical protein
MTNSYGYSNSEHNSSSSKIKNLSTEIQHMWYVKCFVILVIIRFMEL